jgi:hypothetical protein
VINHLSRTRGAEGEQPASVDKFDINGDARVSAIDALMVINRLNRQTLASQPAVLAPPSPTNVDAVWSDTEDEETWGLSIDKMLASSVRRLRR